MTPATSRSSSTSPSLSWVPVVTPSRIVPTYCLSSLISRSWIFVARPTTSINSPVASGSSVPQCPIFLIPSCRRAIATTSCEVIPGSLSINNTPHGFARAGFGLILLQSF